MQELSAGNPKHSRAQVITLLVNVLLALYFMTSQGMAIWLIHAGRAKELVSNEPRIVAAFIAFLALFVASIASYLTSSPNRKWLQLIQAIILLLLAAAITFAEIRLAILGRQGGEEYSITLGFGAVLVAYCAYFTQQALGLATSGRFAIRNFYLWPGILLFFIEIVAIVRLQ